MSLGIELKQNDVNEDMILTVWNGDKEKSLLFRKIGTRFVVWEMLEFDTEERGVNVASDDLRKLANFIQLGT